jgi:hypothetical protein
MKKFFYWLLLLIGLIVIFSAIFSFGAINSQTGKIMGICKLSIGLGLILGISFWLYIFFGSMAGLFFERPKTYGWAKLGFLVNLCFLIILTALSMAANR